MLLYLLVQKAMVLMSALLMFLPGSGLVGVGGSGDSVR
jgi:hypothetical protein